MVTFSPRQDFSELLHQARRDLEAWRSARGAEKESKWAEWARGRLADMMRRPDATVDCLKSSETSIRLAAVALVAEYWPEAEPFAGETLRLAFEDPDARVRGAALTALFLLKCYIADPTGLLQRLVSELFPASWSKEQAADWVRKAEEESAEMQHEMRAWGEELAGPHAAAMLESRASAESYLAHSNVQVRLGALLVLKYHWKPDKSFAQACERMVLEDPDSKVRALAMTGLTGCYFHTDDRRIGGLAARVVYNASAPSELRRAAYRSLFHIRPMPHEAFAKAASDALRFPEDVDWQFVDSFLRDSPGHPE